MTTTDVEPTAKKRVARTEQASPLSVELLDAGTTIADRTVRIARRAAEAGISVSDVAVLGTLGVAEAWAAASPVSGLASPPVKIAKEAWNTTSESVKDLIAAL